MSDLHVHLYLRHFPADAAPADGMCRAIHGLAWGLVAAGATVTVLCENTADATVATPFGYTIRCFARKHGTRSNFGVAPRLSDYVAGLGTGSLVILNGMFNPGVYSLSRCCRRAKVPYVMAAHDPYHPAVFRKRAHVKLPYWYLCERPLLQNAAAVQVLDARHEQFLRARGITRPVIEVPNGLEPASVPPEDALTFNEGPPARLWFLGRIDAHNKGLDILLEAFARLPGSARAQLTIQGPDWGDLAALQAQAQRLGIARHVHFAEADFATPSHKLAAEHDIFCLPSRFEGFSLAALEALLAGRPVLISDVAGLAPHVRASQCGVVVDPTVESVAAGLLHLLHQRPHWKQMGLRGRNHALRVLQWPHIASAALKLYRGLVAAADPGRQSPAADSLTTIAP